MSGFWISVADVLLWRDRKVSSAIMAAVTVAWFLFEVVEYNFITLLCHIFITSMLVVFIWSTAADLFNWYIHKHTNKMPFNNLNTLTGTSCLWQILNSQLVVSASWMIVRYYLTKRSFESFLKLFLNIIIKNVILFTSWIRP